MQILDKLDEQSIGLEAQKYDIHYRKYGMRKKEQFVSPGFSLLHEFELPIDSAVHHLPESSVELGIAPNHIFLRKAEARILVDNVVDLGEHNAGNPILTKGTANQLIQQYRGQYSQIGLMRNFETANRQPKNILVYNYALLSHLLKYRKVPLTRYNRYANTINRLIDNVNDVAAKSTRHQFMMMTLPKQLPDKAVFVKGSRAINIQTLDLFPDDQALQLLELWKLLGKNPETSLYSRLTDHAKNKLNLLFHESGRFIVINLGMLLSWKGGEEKKGFTSQQMQIYYLNLLSSLFTARSVSSKSSVEKDGDGNVVQIVDDGNEVKELEDLELKVERGEDVVGDKVTYIATREFDDLVDVPEDGEPSSYAVGVDNLSEYYLEQGVISVNEHKRHQRLGKSIETLPNPFGEGTLIDLINSAEQALEAPSTVSGKDIPTIFNKSLLDSKIGSMSRDYIEKGLLHAHLVASVASLQNAGVAIVGYDTEVVEDIDNAYEIHAFQVIPVGGSKTTVRFRVPKVNPDGTYHVGGVNYRLRQQRADVPIRKTKPHEVALTSYYSKVFVRRSQKKKDNYPAWLIREVNVRVDETKELTKNQRLQVSYANVFDKSLSLPRPYAILSTRFSQINVGNITFMLDHKKVNELVGEKELQSAIANKEMICGTIDNNALLYMNEAGNVYRNDTNEILGSVESVLGISTEKSPTEVAEIDLMGRSIPMGVLLGYYYGINNLLRKTDATHRIVEKGGRLELADDEYVVRFKDKSLILSRQDKLAELLFSGFNNFKNGVQNYDYADYNKPDTYGALLEVEGLGTKYQREFDLMNQMYIDPITGEVLRSMKEPDVFVDLLVRATELLLTDTYPDEMSGKYLRTRGYERFSGHFYQEMIKELRRFKSSPVSAKNKFSMHPNAVWSAIQTDPAVSIIEESNPVRLLKEQENLTFSGTWGRSSKTMMKRHRVFDPNDIGVISEATVDSGDVGITIFSTPNPNVKNLLGLPLNEGYDKNNASSLVSSSSLLMPLNTADDAKRAVFTSIQMDHTVAAHDYHPSPVRTGYESTVAHRTHGVYTYIARGNGRIVSISDKVVVIKYDDSNLGDDHIEIGRRYGKVSGKTVPHDLVCDLPVNSRVKEKDVVVYHSGFYDRNLVDKTQVDLKIGTLARVALVEGADTIEDSSSISPEFAKRLSANVSNVREITLDVSKDIIGVAKPGDVVTNESILCTINDTLTGHDALDELTNAALANLAANTPRAKYSGKVSKVDVTYNASYEDMTDTLRNFVERADKQRKKDLKALGKKALTGRSESVDMDTVIIRIYIDSVAAMGDGDKIVVSNQLKSVIRDVVAGSHVTKSGLPIDVFFGFASQEARIVTSAERIGTTNVLMRLASQRMLEAYDS